MYNPLCLLAVAGRYQKNCGGQNETGGRSKQDEGEESSTVWKKICSGQIQKIEKDSLCNSNAVTFSGRDLWPSCWNFFLGLSGLLGHRKQKFLLLWTATGWNILPGFWGETVHKINVESTGWSFPLIDCSLKQILFVIM